MRIELLAAAGSALAVAALVVEVDGTDGARRAATWARRGRTHAAMNVGGPRPPVKALAWRGAGIAAVIGGCVGWLLGGVAVAGVAASGAVGASLWRVRRRADGLQRARERAAPALARSLADALRGGASVRGALADAAEDRSIPAPLRSTLLDAARAVQLGAPIEASLTAVATQGGATLRLLCGTVVLHLDAGGSLARELRLVATDGEVAQRIDEDRVAATAQARATVRVVAALPILALLGAEAASRDFLPRIASKPIPFALLLLGFALEAAAIAAARAIVGRRT